MLTLLLATNNPGKREELSSLLKDISGLTLQTPRDMGLRLRIREDGSTYAENAALKARAYAQASGLPALADDSGLEVAALDGAPGLFSARYAPKRNADDADRRAFLLSKLRGRERPWAAQFRSTACLALPNGELYTTEGICMGEIIPEERGTQGFGYDAIFLLRNRGKTMAELSLAEKNRLSHRARAIAEMRPILESLLNKA